MSNAVQFYKKGDVLDYTPGAAVTAGDIVAVAGRAGLVQTDINAASTGSVQMVGLVRGNKLSTDDMTAGDSVYWDATLDSFTLTAGGNILAGSVVYDAGTSVSTCVVALNVFGNVLTEDVAT